MSQVPATLEDVSHVYGTVPVLRRVSAQLAGGKCYLLLGPNGAGKSTLLRIVAGLLRPTFGRATLWGSPPTDARARVGYMSHASMLFDEYTAAENLHYFAALYAERACLAVPEVLRSVGLDPALRRPIGAYSQGMRQRVSLARVLLSQPDLLLLDEPFSNMDAASAAEMLRLLAQQRDTGRTVLLTTHQQALAEPIADELLSVENGVLKAMA